MTNELSGRTALITGAGRGIGAAIARGMSEAGAGLVLVARTTTQLDETAERIRRDVPGSDVRTVAGDVSDDAARLELVEKVRAAGHIDILINNAGSVEPLGATASLRPEAVRQAFDLNLVAPMMLASAFSPAMAESGWGRIVNVSSGVVAHPASMIGGGTYAATKAALEAHTVNLAAELSGTGVTVNVYRPGGVDTAMQEWIRSQDPDRIGARLHERFVNSHAEGRLITADESAAALLGHLVGDDAAQTGAVWDLEHTLTP